MEVAGAALATDIARLTEIALFLFWIRRRKPGFAFPPRELFRIDPAMFAKILSRSGMMLFSETAWVVSETMITAMYNSRGGADTVRGDGRRLGPSPTSFFSSSAPYIRLPPS